MSDSVRSPLTKEAEASLPWEFYSIFSKTSIKGPTTAKTTRKTTDVTTKGNSNIEIFASVKNLIRLFQRIFFSLRNVCNSRFARKTYKKGSRDGFPFYIYISLV